MSEIIEPYDPSTLRQTLDRLGVPAKERLAVAVSGGADSMALACLANEVADITCLTVDHGLRPESAEEAETVESMMATLGIPHVTLEWQGDKPPSNIQAEARQARYELLGRWCMANGADFLLTGHHQDDQAETLLLRLARGSGVYGLAAMPETRPLQGTQHSVTLVRPLLDVSRDRLRATLEARGIDWIEDPSNHNRSFDRVRARQLLSNPPLAGLTTDRLASTARRLRRTRDALEHYERHWLSSAAHVTAEGNIILSLESFKKAPEEICLRGVATVCRFISAQGYVPRMEKLERAVAAIQEPDFKGLTLYRCRFLPYRPGKVFVCRELASMESRKKIGDNMVFDGRYEILVSEPRDNLFISALGQEGWNQAVSKWPELRDSELPFEARLVLPAVFVGKNLLAIPDLGYDCGEHTAIQLSRKGIGWPKK